MKIALSRKNLWEALPAPIRTVAGAMLGLVPQQYLLGQSFRKAYQFVEEVQWWPAERLREYQLAQLKRICTLAYERTPYYRRVFDSVGFVPDAINHLTDLSSLPTIDRATLHDHLDEMCTVAPSSAHVDYITTGGTSGKPLRFYIGANRSAIEYAHLVSGWKRAGYRLGIPMAVLRGRVVKPGRDGLRYEYDPLLRNHYFSNFHMTEENMARYLERIRTLGPCFLHVYPSSVAALSRYIASHGVEPPRNVLGILAESENIYPEQRQLVESVFSKRYFSSYGHTEKLVAAAECEKSKAYHVWPTYGYLELLGEDGKAVTSPGKRGEIVGTGFINTVVPFIRYRTGDYATYVGERCAQCGREHMILEDIRGHRTQEVLVTRSGTSISWTALNVHDDTFDNVLQFQFVQEIPGSAILKIVPGKAYGESDRARIVQRLEHKLDHQLDIRIEMVPSLQLSARGKMIYVDQRIAGMGPAGHSSHP